METNGEDTLKTFPAIKIKGALQRSGVVAVLSNWDAKNAYYDNGKPMVVMDSGVGFSVGYYRAAKTVSFHSQVNDAAPVIFFSCKAFFPFSIWK